MTSSSNAPSIDIKDVLEDSSSGLGLSFGVNMFIGSMPNKPDNCICIYDYPGESQDLFGYEKPSVQVLVRNKNYETAWNLCKDIKYFLHDGFNNFIINQTRYIRIYSISDALPLGMDESNRYKMSINFRTERSGND